MNFLSIQSNVIGLIGVKVPTIVYVAAHQPVKEFIAWAVKLMWS